MEIFDALSDPTKRNIIEGLHQYGPQSIKQLSHGLPMSRQALTKHLNRLIRAKIVRAEFAGKEKIHQLERKAVDSLHNWMAPDAEVWGTRLSALEKHLGVQHAQCN